MKKKTKQKIAKIILVILFHIIGSGMLLYGLLTATTLN